jgi:hypothetical protein
MMAHRNTTKPLTTRVPTTMDYHLSSYHHLLTIHEVGHNAYHDGVVVTTMN